MTAPTDPAAMAEWAREIAADLHGEATFADPVLTRDLAAAVVAIAAERDRLARVLACERGDAEAAPDGWRLTAGQLWRRSDSGRTIGQVGHSGRSGVDGWSWQSRGTDRPTVLGTAPTALEAMEAADAAREARDG